MDGHRWEGEDLLLELWVQPRASRDEFAGRHGGAWRVRIKAPPVAGQANAYLLRWLADRFGVGRDRVVLVSGAASRYKQVRIRGPVPPVGFPGETSVPNSAPTAADVIETTAGSGARGR